MTCLEAQNCLGKTVYYINYGATITLTSATLIAVDPDMEWALLKQNEDLVTTRNPQNLYSSAAEAWFGAAAELKRMAEAVWKKGVESVFPKTD